MIDSLDLILKVYWLDIEKLLKKGIVPQVIEEKNIKYYIFSYKQIQFKYCKQYHYLLLMTKPSTLLKKKDITLSDITPYKKIVFLIVREILIQDKYAILVDEIHFYCDLKVDKMIDMYILLLNKHRYRFKYMKQNEYDTSSYMKSAKGTGQTRFNFYNKYEEMLNQVKEGTAIAEEAEEYKGILRLEIQHRPPRIYNENKKYNESEFNKGIEKRIDRWWSRQAMEKYYFEFLEQYLYKGDYHKRKLCKKLIDKSKQLTSLWKKKLNKFSLFESRYRIDGVVAKKKKCDDTVKEYIKRLNELNINPVTIPKESSYDTLENLVKIARRKAEEDYFK